MTIPLGLQSSPLSRAKPRKIWGASAILLPIQGGSSSESLVDWTSFDEHVKRTLAAGLIPAINMDTGYANLIDEEIRDEAIRRTAALTKSSSLEHCFISGVFVHDQPGDPFDLEQYRKGLEPITAHDGTPIFFQSYGLVQQEDRDILASYSKLASRCEAFYFFELGAMFAPFGKVYSMDLYRRLMQIPNCLGAKHSSLRRIDEWARLEARDQSRPGFRVLTGNDLAIDMVKYGSDYLLGLSTFAPDAFARRDRYWSDGDPRFYQLNDLLQYLGAFAFREPTSAYKHSAAMFLKLRGWIECDHVYPGAPTRPESDRQVLQLILADLDRLMR